MRLNSYVSGLGDVVDYGDVSFGSDTSPVIATNDVGWSLTANDLAQIQANVDSAYNYPNPSVVTTPSTVNQNASNGWTDLLQNVIKTGVNTASKIAVTQNAVPQLNPGTYYSYNTKTGSYTMGANSPGQASVFTSGNTSFFSSPIALIGLGIVAVAIIAKGRR